jgi:hypothetical protein
MIGFPYSYGDELSEEEALENFKLFLKNYGATLCVNGVLFFLSKAAYAVDKTPASPGKPGEVVPAPDSPVFAPLVPPTSVIYSKPWGICGVGAIAWICITAASTGNPALIIACSSLLLYGIGAKQ